MADAVDLCLDNIDEFVNDEHKLVTYKWLSLTLSINVNLAKQLLFTFVVNQRNKKDNESLCVTYIVSGLTKSDGGQMHKVQIVPEEKLESVKSLYSVLTSCHIYSVHRGKLKDTNTLYMTDYEALKQNLYKTSQYSAISCPAAVLRDADQVDQLAQAKPANDPVKPSGKVQPPASNAKNKKPTGIAGMFAKAPAKSAKDTEKHPQVEDQKNTQKEVAEKKTNSKGPKAGVMSFFSKHAGKPRSENVSSKAIKAEPQNEDVTVEEICEASSISPEKPQEKETSAKRGIKHKVHSEDEDSQSSKQKKRRRIKVQVESSSEEEEEMEVESPIPSPAAPEPDDTEDIVGPSPVKEPATAARAPRPKSDETDICGKVKKRKLVSKTFVNDEGFMVTEKVYEDEWEDAPPDPEKNSSSTKGTSPKKKISPAKKISPSKASSGKQTSLMNFFKKK